MSHVQHNITSQTVLYIHNIFTLFPLDSSNAEQTSRTFFFTTFIGKLFNEGHYSSSKDQSQQLDTHLPCTLIGL